MTDLRKPIFDALRTAKGGKLGADDVTIMDDALDRIGVPKEATMQLGAKGEALIKQWEGYATDLGDGRVKAYPDPATGGDPYTIGWGSTGRDIVKGTVWSRAQADARFREHVAQFAAGVTEALDGSPTTQDQFDAMVSLAYNVGIGNFTSSTLLKKHKAGDYAGAADQFGVWIYANGKKMQGLVNRRAEERRLYEGRA